MAMCTLLHRSVASGHDAVRWDEGLSVERRAEVIPLDGAQVSRLVARAVPEAVVHGCHLLPGGRVNTNYQVDTDRGPLVLRLYARDGAARDKEAALFDWLDDVPVPKVLGIGESELAPYAVVELLSGRPLVAAGAFGAAEWTTAGC